MLTEIYTSPHYRNYIFFSCFLKVLPVLGVNGLKGGASYLSKYGC
jgi:hypothetical protein